MPTHKAFFLFDRSIPVAFSRGQNYNVHRAILLEAGSWSSRLAPRDESGVPDGVLSSTGGQHEQRPKQCRLPLAEREGYIRRAFTLVEILVATVFTLIIMAATVTLFGSVTEGIAGSRAIIETMDRLRGTAERLALDLRGATATMLPPLRPEWGLGYFEYRRETASPRRSSPVAGSLPPEQRHDRGRHGRHPDVHDPQHDRAVHRRLHLRQSDGERNGGRQRRQRLQAAVGNVHLPGGGSRLVRARHHALSARAAGVAGQAIQDNDTRNPASRAIASTIFRCDRWAARRIPTRTRRRRGSITG